MRGPKQTLVLVLDPLGCHVLPQRLSRDIALLCLTSLISVWFIGLGKVNHVLFRIDFDFASSMRVPICFHLSLRCVLL